MCMENKQIFKDFLKNRGIKQRWLADQLGVSEITISNWANGSHYPRDRYVKKLKEMFQFKYEEEFLYIKISEYDE